VIAGDERTYAGKTWICLQSHQTLVGWEPEKTPALWKEVVTVVDIPVWKQPTGAHDAYRLGDIVIYKNKTWECISDYCVYAPGVFGWKEITL